jgi:hypothetical protein
VVKKFNPERFQAAQAHHGAIQVGRTVWSWLYHVISSHLWSARSAAWLGRSRGTRPSQRLKTSWDAWPETFAGTEERV